MSLFWSQWKPQFWNADVIRFLKNDWKISLIRAAMAVKKPYSQWSPPGRCKAVRNCTKQCNETRSNTQWVIRGRSSQQTINELSECKQVCVWCCEAQSNTAQRSTKHNKAVQSSAKHRSVQTESRDEPRSAEHRSSKLYKAAWSSAKQYNIGLLVHFPALI